MSDEYTIASAYGTTIRRGDPDLSWLSFHSERSRESY